MERPYESHPDITLEVMLEMNIYKLNMSNDPVYHSVVMEDIGFLIVEQLIRMNK